MIFLYLIWTDSGITLRWRLWRLLRVLPDGRHGYPREGGGEIGPSL